MEKLLALIYWRKCCWFRKVRNRSDLLLNSSSHDFLIFTLSLIGSALTFGAWGGWDLGVQFFRGLSHGSRKFEEPKQIVRCESSLAQPSFWIHLSWAFIPACWWWLGVGLWSHCINVTKGKGFLFSAFMVCSLLLVLQSRNLLLLSFFFILLGHHNVDSFSPPSCSTHFFLFETSVLPQKNTAFF